MYVQNLSRKDLAPGSKPRRLPNAILLAIDNASHVVGIPRCVKDTFAEICRYVKQSDPLSPIWPTKEAIGMRIGADKRTVHRHIAWLRDNGLVEVMDQGRKSSNGKFIYAAMRLTRKAAELVLLLKPIESTETILPSDNLSSGHTLTEPSYSSSQPPALINNLPADLSHLTSLGVQKMGIFKLMAMANAKGKRLSDIVTVLNDLISKSRGGQLFGLLRNRINDNKDYSYIARLARESQSKQSEEAAIEAQLSYVRDSLKAKTLVNASLSVIFMIDRKGEFAQRISASNSATLPVRDLDKWSEKMVTGELLFATPEMELTALDNIEKIKLRNKLEAKSGVFKMMFKGAIGQGAESGAPMKEIFGNAVSQSEKVVQSSIELMPKGRVGNMEAIKALLGKGIVPQVA